jgi:hypothetical protein
VTFEGRGTVALKRAQVRGDDPEPGCELGVAPDRGVEQACRIEIEGIKGPENCVPVEVFSFSRPELPDDIFEQGKGRLATFGSAVALFDVRHVERSWRD